MPEMRICCGCYSRVDVFVLLRDVITSWPHCDFGIESTAEENVNFLIDNNKHNAELQRTDAGTKVTGEFSTRGPNV